MIEKSDQAYGNYESMMDLTEPNGVADAIEQNQVAVTNAKFNGQINRFSRRRFQTLRRRGFIAN